MLYFKDRQTGATRVEDVGDNLTFEIRLEDGGGTRYLPAGKNGADADAKAKLLASRLEAKKRSEDLGFVVIDPLSESDKRPRLEDTFDDYILDAEKRRAMEAWEQACPVKREFLELVKITYVDQVTRERILDFDEAIRKLGRSPRTIANKRQRLQSMLRWAGIDPEIFPPKPKYETKLPTIYTPDQLAALFRAANPYQMMVCSLALKLGLRDQEVQFAEFTDVLWHESVFRVRSKPKYGFVVKDYEQRDIPIPRDFLLELKAWKDAHSGQNLIVPTAKGKPNTKLLIMVKRLARRAEIECGWCKNCVAGRKGDRACEEFELHKFRRTCITTWLRSKIDPAL